MGIKTWKSEKIGVTIEIDYDKCDGNAECADICPGEVYEIIDEKSQAINVDNCVECCACVDACPVSAIKHSSCE
jgi:NAD-dependent dihydropyrimidine dehydrogenase PreA subunit